MRRPAATKILETADVGGWATCVGKERGERSESGQFFTPIPIAQRLASWFSEAGLNRPAIHLLDPGAGGGALTAAVVDRIVSLRAANRLPELSEVTLQAWELDEAFLPNLRKCLAACVEVLEAAGVRAKFDVQHGSYIDGAVGSLDFGLFNVGERSGATHAILNPPIARFPPNRENAHYSPRSGLKLQISTRPLSGWRFDSWGREASCRRSLRGVSVTGPIFVGSAASCSARPPSILFISSTPGRRPSAAMMSSRKIFSST